MNPTTTFTRRNFVQTAAAGMAVATIVPRHVLGGPKFVPPSAKVNVALIGAGGQGRWNLRQLFQLDDVQVMALADPCESWNLDRFYYKGRGGRLPVKEEIEKQYAQKTPNFRVVDYEDFRVMLDKQKAIDAVLIATPDHLHAYVSLTAMRQGKHVYCEKPMTHNIHEARLVARVAKQTGVATQMGNQGHSRDGIRQTCEWIWAGAIGTVREVHSWVPTKRWNPELTKVPTDTPSVPDGLNWDLWLGPRAPRPWHPVYAPVSWRDFWAFGTGGFGDFGCHDMDAPCWALDLHAPDSVEAFGADMTDPEIQPHGCLCYYRFPANQRHRGVKLTWYDGGIMPELPEAYDRVRSKYRRGVLFVGDKGTIACEGAGGPPQLALFDKSATFEKPKPTLKRSPGHHRDWIDACKGGEPAGSNFEYGARLTEITLLGVLGLRMGKKIRWDAAKMQVPGMPAADEIIHGTYRKGWELPT
jgi:predicted dehydrogenase